MAKPGRPPALDSFGQQKVCSAIAIGCGLEMAAAYAGCRPITARRTANRDPKFEQQWRDAELTSVVQPLRTMQKASAENWKAAAWFIERSYSSLYAKHHPHMISLEQMQVVCNELVQEISTHIPDAKVRRKVRKHIDLLAKKWYSDWRPGHTLKRRRRNSPDPEWMTGKPAKTSTAEQPAEQASEAPSAGETADVNPT